MTTNTRTQHEALYKKAQAGLAAGEAAAPAPMYVVGTSPSGEKTYYPPVMDGVCGFGWVNVKPGTSSFARWLKANTHAHTDSYYGGVTYWVRGFGQSYERKVAFARAFAAVLKEAGIKAYGTGRLD